MTSSSLFTKEIQNEIRRRTQIYQSLDYYFSSFSYFDFFSKDTFDFLKIAQQFVFYSEKKKITSEILFFLFFSSNIELKNVLKKYVSKPVVFQQFVEEYHFKTSPVQNFFSFFKNSNENDFSENLFSDDVHLLFENAMNNCLSRFKSPILTLEILFLTLMEEKENKLSLLLKKMIENETDWFLLRYQLMKKIHHDETSIRTNVSINQQFFGYLLKTKLTNLQFDRLNQLKLVDQGVSLFRNTLISTLLKRDFFEIASKDLQNSMKIQSERKYSDEISS